MDIKKLIEDKKNKTFDRQALKKKIIEIADLCAKDYLEVKKLVDEKDFVFNVDLQKEFNRRINKEIRYYGNTVHLNIYYPEYNKEYIKIEDIDKYINNLENLKDNLEYNIVEDLRIDSINYKKHTIKTDKYNFKYHDFNFLDYEIIKEYANGKTELKINNWDLFLEFINFDNETTQKILKLIDDDVIAEYKELMKEKYNNKYNIIYILTEKHNINSRCIRPNYLKIFEKLNSK